MEFGEKIKEFAQKKFGGVGKLAQILEMKQPQLSKHINGKTKPGLDFLIKLGELGLDLNFLIINKERNSKSMYRIEAIVPAGNANIDFVNDWSNTEEVYFDPATHFVVIIDRNNGDSMRPFISPNDRIMCSVKNKVKKGDIVLARWGRDKGAVKIHGGEVGDSILLVSYNQVEGTIPVKKNETQLFKVVQIIKS